jgi:Cu(I)/Ag(I) efflux system periplasmic protein CusF
MKNQTIVVLSIAMLGGGTAIAAGMPGMEMDPPAARAAEKPQTNHAVGVVKNLDGAKGTIKLAHEPVPSIKWPAMTMEFKISKELAASIKAGDRVDFEFTAKGMDATVTRIAVIK